MDVQSRWTWETPPNQVSWIEWSNLQFWTWSESCEKVQNKIIKSNSNPNPVKQNFKSNPNPSPSWKSVGFKCKSMFLSGVGKEAKRRKWCAWVAVAVWCVSAQRFSCRLQSDGWAECVETASAKIIVPTGTLASSHCLKFWTVNG